MQKNALSISKGRNRASSQIKETAYSNAKDTIIGIGFTQQSAVFGGILGEITGAIMGTLTCLLYTSPSPRDRTRSRMPSSA